MRSERSPSPPARATRSGAGDGVRRAAVGRHRQAKTGRPSAATCSRRSVRASMPASGQASTPAKPPLASNCSTHQPTCRPAPTTTRRSGTTPAAAQAGACGSQGGATSASQPPAADSRARAGKSRLSSPTPLRSTRISVKFPRGQPPPGSSASSSAWPLGMVAAGKLASASPRQTSPLASTSARAIGDGMAFILKNCQNLQRRGAETAEKMRRRSNWHRPAGEPAMLGFSLRNALALHLCVENCCLQRELPGS